MKQLKDILTESVKIRWRKGEKHFAWTSRQTQKVMYSWEGESANHKWSIEPSGEHPTYGYTLSREKPNATYWAVFKDGQKFGKTKMSIKKAKDSIQSWVDRFEGTEFDK